MHRVEFDRDGSCAQEARGTGVSDWTAYRMSKVCEKSPQPKMKTPPT